ncbi:hypothetical protein ACSMXN_11885 [Jatrophihabitans sp. DSM 45814]
MPILVRAAMLGVATGSRSTLGLAVLTLTAGREPARAASGAVPAGRRLRTQSVRSGSPWTNTAQIARTWTDSTWTHRTWTKRAAALALAGELVGDKLPQTPSRLEPVGVASRVVMGLASGAILSFREGHSSSRMLLAAAAGAAGAVVGTGVGATWRDLAAEKFGSDLPGALIEDGVAITLASAAVRG